MNCECDTGEVVRFNFFRFLFVLAALKTWYLLFDYMDGVFGLISFTKAFTVDVVSVSVCARFLFVRWAQ